jgi:hypothetical protein
MPSRLVWKGLNPFAGTVRTDEPDDLFRFNFKGYSVIGDDTNKIFG